MAQQIQLRRGTSSQWTTANPILADGEVGIETNTGLYKVGNGTDNWTTRPYSTLRNIDTGTVINMSDQATPSTPSAGSLNFYAKDLGGRMMLRQQGPSGLSTPLQPSFFQNNIMMINTNVTTTITSIGQTPTSAGTLSHPAPTETYGYMTNFATAATAASTSGTGNTTDVWVRGSVAGANGFFFNARLAYPDASYEQTGAATTGSRTFVGLSNQLLATTTALDNPAGHFAGFFRRSVNAGAIDTNWQFATKENTTINVQDTGLPFLAQKIYDFYIFCPPQGTEIFWRIDNVTDDTTASGSTTTSLPGNNIYMKALFNLRTINAVARNVRMQRVYIESDK
jgi:hypothetical protein